MYKHELAFKVLSIKVQGYITRWLP